MNEKPLWESFVNEGDDSIGEKIESQTIWHELGHLIGHSIAGKLGYDFGKIIQLNLTDKDGDPCIKIDSNLYIPKGRVHKYPDGYGTCKYIYTEEDEQILKESLNDSYKFIIYSIYLILGGLFNIYALNKNPKSQDFEKCYIDEIGEIEIGTFVARAGKDWSKLRNLIKLKEWDEEIFIEFRLKLFYLLKDFAIYESFKELITKTDLNNNGKVIEGIGLLNIIEKVTLILDENNEFVEEVTKLTMNTQTKIKNIIINKF